MHRTVSLTMGLSWLALTGCGERVDGVGEAFALDLGIQSWGQPGVDLERTALEIGRGEETFALGERDDDAQAWTWDEVPPLEGERLTLRWRRAQRVVAHARTAPLSADDGTVVAEAWALPVDQPTADVALTALVAPLGVSLAASAGGDLYIAGGSRLVLADPDEPAPGTASLWRLERTDPTPFPRLISNRIGADGTVDPRVWATLTMVSSDGREALLLTGGQRDASTGTPLDDALVVDPDSGAPIGTLKMSVARSHHHATVLDGNRVMLVAGDADVATWEVLDVAGRSSSGASTISGVGGWGPACNDHPDGGVVCCGGGVPVPGTDDLEPARGCHRIDPDADTPDLALPDLPFGVTGAALAVLDDGTLVLCGGSNGTLSPDLLAAARNNILVLEPGDDAWTPAGRLASARVHHAMLRLDGRRALVVGGIDAAAARPPQLLGRAAGPPEVLDLDEATTRVLDATAGLTGAWPAVVDVPGDLAAIIEGAHVEDGRTRGGRVLGLMGRPTNP